MQKSLACLGVDAKSIREVKNNLNEKIKTFSRPFDFISLRFKQDKFLDNYPLAVSLSSSPLV